MAHPDHHDHDHERSDLPIGLAALGVGIVFLGLVIYFASSLAH